MPIKSLDVTTLKQWLDKEEAVLVDVREQNEYDAGHIPGSVFVPLSGFSQDKIPPHEGKKLVMQCRSGARSYKACEILQSLDNVLEVYNLDAGILGWAAAGYAIK